MLCEQCHRLIGRGSVVHVNIAQDEPVHYFCSKKCRLEWCYEVAENGGIVQ